MNIVYVIAFTTKNDMYNIRIILTFKECMGENRFEFKQGKISPLEYLNLKHHKYTRKKEAQFCHEQTGQKRQYV